MNRSILKYIRTKDEVFACEKELKKFKERFIKIVKGFYDREYNEVENAADEKEIDDRLKNDLESVEIDLIIENGKLKITGDSFLFTEEMEFDEIIKQSDAIEELCDENVIHYANGYHLIEISANGDILFKDQYDYGFKLEYALQNNYEIYGAIWTEKGLIFVAKIKISTNGETDWELL